MFSFLKKKTSPNTPPEEQDIIPGPESSSNGDGFVVINHENTSSNLYPSVQPPPFPINPLPKISPIAPVHYLQGVPFKISAEIETTYSFEMHQSQIDGILALMTKRLQLEEDYDFSLEREIVSQ